MICPRCKGPTRTPNTFKTEGGSVVVRVRRCTSRKCGWSFTTSERRCDPPTSPKR